MTFHESEGAKSEEELLYEGFSGTARSLGGQVGNGGGIMASNVSGVAVVAQTAMGYEEGFSPGMAWPWFGSSTRASSSSSSSSSPALLRRALVLLVMVRDDEPGLLVVMRVLVVWI